MVIVKRKIWLDGKLSLKSIKYKCIKDHFVIVNWPIMYLIIKHGCCNLNVYSLYHDWQENHDTMSTYSDGLHLIIYGYYCSNQNNKYLLILYQWTKYQSIMLRKIKSLVHIDFHSFFIYWRKRSKHLSDKYSIN